jgi:hypothetical protein
MLVGASGFSGSHVMQQLANNDAVELTTLSRKIPKNLPTNVSNIIFDFETLDAGTEIPYSDHLIICLGSHLKVWELLYVRHKDRPAFVRVDKEYIINLALAAKRAGTKNISIMSAPGADSKSSNIYFKTKGEVEEEIIKMNFESTHIFRPGHMCNRIDWEKNKDGFRFDVFLGEYACIFFTPFMVGKLSDFKVVDVKVLAQSITTNLFKKSTGIQYFTYSNFLN